MTVKELIEALQKCPENYAVWADNYDIRNIEIYENIKVVELLFY